MTTEPHDLPLRFLAETGVVGFLLLLGLVGAGAAACVAGVRRAGAPERGAAAALAIGAGAYALHSLVDIHWDFVAVSAPAFFSVGALAGLGGEAPVARRRPAVAGLVAAAVGGRARSTRSSPPMRPAG